MTAIIVYVLCAATSLACAILLLRGYRRAGSRLLLWSALCFVFFAAQNAVLFLDHVVIPGKDLSLFRNGLGAVGLLLLLFGLIWETE